MVGTRVWIKGAAVVSASRLLIFPASGPGRLAFHFHRRRDQRSSHAVHPDSFSESELEDCDASPTQPNATYAGPNAAWGLVWPADYYRTEIVEASFLKIHIRPDRPAHRQCRWCLLFTQKNWQEACKARGPQPSRTTRPCLSIGSPQSEEARLHFVGSRCGITTWPTWIQSLEPRELRDAARRVCSFDRERPGHVRLARGLSAETIRHRLQRRDRPDTHAHDLLDQARRRRQTGERNAHPLRGRVT